MARKPAAFKEADVTRALKAAKKADVAVRVIVRPGELVIEEVASNSLDAVAQTGKPNAEEEAKANEWDNA
jgi:hypothetical protein